MESRVIFGYGCVLLSFKRLECEDFDIQELKSSLLELPLDNNIDVVKINTTEIVIMIGEYADISDGFFKIPKIKVTNEMIDDAIRIEKYLEYNYYDIVCKSTDINYLF